MPDTDPAASALDGIRERAGAAAAMDVDVLSAFNGVSVGGVIAASAVDVPRLLKAAEAALTGAATLDAESARFGKIADDADPGSAVEVAALAASQAYDRSARILREAITAALAGKEAGDGC